MDSTSPSSSEGSHKRKKPLKTTNAYFFWVTREQGSFDWFKGIMNEVAELDLKVKPELITYLQIPSQIRERVFSFAISLLFIIIYVSLRA